MKFVYLLMEETHYVDDAWQSVVGVFAKAEDAEAEREKMQAEVPEREPIEYSVLCEKVK